MTSTERARHNQKAAARRIRTRLAVAATVEHSGLTREASL